MSHLIIGTAGHIDHGKTTLVRALTGINTDRLKEEQERGITIELGFAHLDLPGLPPVGIVDVPGHEKFVHHMVAGVAGIDLLILVIAADEGIMPQTREHLDICRLLGVGAGLVVLTKADLVEPDWLEMVSQEVTAFLKGTFLEGGPVIPVSSATGLGIPALRETLRAMLARVAPRPVLGIPRLPIDRVFTMKGFGTVVTGTLIAGTLRVGDEVEILPPGLESRIRGIQVYGTAVEEARAGQRTAINLQGAEKSTIERGFTLTHPGRLDASYLFDAKLTLLAAAARPLANRTRVRLHLGTSEIFARVITLGREKIEPGETAMVQFRLESPGVALPRDRFVIRSYSPAVTLGGGEMVDTRPAKHRQFSGDAVEKLEVLAGADASRSIPLLVRAAGLAGTGEPELARRLNLERREIARQVAALLKAGQLFLVPGVPPLYVHADTAQAFDEQSLALLADYHRQNPLKPGLLKEELRSKFPAASARLFLALLDRLQKRGKIAVEQEVVRLAGHRVQLRVDQEEVKGRVEELFRKAGLQTPSLELAAQELRLEPKALREAIGLLVAEKRLFKISEELLMHGENLAAIRERVTEFLRQNGKLTVTDFKDLTGVSRKYSVPLLEHFDRNGVTIRVGDHRVLRKSAG
jgi:selenocysteine-specific elongation factor